MKKIPTLFIRDASNPKFVTREVNPECQWVIDGEGVATRKWDGSACLIRGGKLFKRVTDDGFFLIIEAADARFSEAKTRELLEYNETRLRKLVNGMHEILFELDAQGRIIFLNPAWQTLTGITIM